MPSDLRIAPPSGDIPADRAAFSGIWVGKWDNALDTALAVEEITPTSVFAVYAWGTAPTWNINRPGWTRARGEFAGDELRVRTAVLVTYRLRPDGRLDATFHGQQPVRTTMTRVFPRTGTEGQPSIAIQAQTGECITEQVTFNSGSLRLRGTVMRPKTEGRLPVVIFNHGSRFQFQAGSVVSLEANPIVADGTPCPTFVTEKKWIFFVPWRRGYGGSQGDRYSDIFARGGPNVVEESIQRLRGVEADDVNAAQSYITTQPFADGGKVAVTGVSLGGIVSVFAAGKNMTAYRAVVDQAGGWGQGYEPLVSALIQAGRNIQAPILLQHGTQDQVAPLVVSRQVAEELNRLGRRVTLRTYPIGHSFNPFAPTEVWLADFIAFLEENLR